MTSIHIKKDLETAFQAAQAMIGSANTEQACSIDADFSFRPMPKTEEEANKVAVAILKQILPLFHASSNPKKIEQAWTICKALQTLPIGSSTIAQVKAVQGVLEAKREARLQEIRQHLSKLSQLKEWLYTLNGSVIQAFPVVRYMEFLSGANQTVLNRKFADALLVSYQTFQISDEILVELMESPDNLAFITKYNGLKPSDTGKSFLHSFIENINSENNLLTVEEEARSLKYFAVTGSPEVRWIATLMLREIEGHLAKRYSNSHVSVLNQYRDVVFFKSGPNNTHFDERHPAFFQTYFPCYEEFEDIRTQMVQYQTNVPNFISNSYYHKYLKTAYETFRQYQKEIEDLDDHYGSLFNEYQLLANAGTSSAPLVFLTSTLPSLRTYGATRSLELPLLPDPSGFRMKNRCVFRDIDTSVFYPSLPPEPRFAKVEGKRDNSNSTPTLSSSPSPSSAKKKNKHKARLKRAGSSASPVPTTPTREETASSPSSSASESSPSPSSSPLPSSPRSSPTPFIKDLIETKVNRTYALAAASPVKVENKENTNQGSISPTLFAGQLKNIHYAERVTLWNTDPKAALARLKFKPVDPDDVIWKHATSAVDCFIGTEYSRRAKWGKMHDGYYLQADVKWKKLETGQEPPKERQKEKNYRGFFRYAFNGSGVLYHRDFGIKSNNEILDAVSNSKLFHEEDFPSLEEAHQDFLSSKKAPEVIKLGEATYMPHADGTVSVIERTKDYILEIRLYKKGKLKI